MQNTNSAELFQNQTHLANSKNRNETAYQVPILIGACGGVICGLFGFLLFVVFSATGGADKSLDYAGVGSLVISFAFLAVAAHFMDKSDEKKRIDKKIRAERFMRNNHPKKHKFSLIKFTGSL